jgi:hypothetical protein
MSVGEQKSLNRRELLRWGAVGAGAAAFSTAASCVGLPSLIYNQPNAAATNPVAPQPAVQASLPMAPGGIDPQLFARAKAAMDQHRIWYRDKIGIVDFTRPSSDKRFHLVDLHSGNVQTHLVAHGRGSDPDHTGTLQLFSNQPGSYASSRGTYTTADTYDGKHGLSMRLNGLDDTNDNALARAIVIHGAWYAEPEMIEQHGMLGRSEGCFAMPKESQWQVMQQLAAGRMIYAEKLA